MVRFIVSIIVILLTLAAGAILASGVGLVTLSVNGGAVAGFVGIIIGLLVIAGVIQEDRDGQPDYLSGC